MRKVEANFVVRAPLSAERTNSNSARPSARLSVRLCDQLGAEARARRNSSLARLRSQCAGPSWRRIESAAFASRDSRVERLSVGERASEQAKKKALCKWRAAAAQRGRSRAKLDWPLRRKSLSPRAHKSSGEQIERNGRLKSPSKANSADSLKLAKPRARPPTSGHP